jgi:hypothetical protein
LVYWLVAAIMIAGALGSALRNQITAAAGTAPSANSTRQAVSMLAPEPSRASAISGPTISPSAWVPNTMPTSLPRSLRFAYSLTMTALDRVVAADADAEQEPESDQHPVRPGQAPLAAGQVRVASEH